MALTISQTAGKVADRSDTLAETPYVKDITEALGIFGEHYSSQKTVEIKRTTRDNFILEDRNWDERGQNIVAGEAATLTLKIPHFPLSESIRPHDIDGVIAADATDVLSLATVAEVRAEKMLAIRDAFALTQKAARWQLLNDGSVMAPHGTMRTAYGDTVNYYDEFGVVRESLALEIAAGADPRSSVRAAVAALRVAHRGRSMTRPVFLCGGEFFSALISNEYVAEAWTYSQMGQSNLAGLFGVGAGFEGLDAAFPSITVWGATFVDCGAAGYDKANSFVPFVKDDQAILLPVGGQIARTYYAPANRFSAINKKSQGMYWFEKASDEKIQIDAELNFMNGLLAPASVMDVTIQ